MILLCLIHFSPSRTASPPTSNFESRASFVFSKWPNLFDKTSRTSSGSVIIILGHGPNHVNESLPCSSMTRWRRGATRETMSWARSMGTGLDKAAAMSRCSSLRSPLKNRYWVPLRPWALRDRSMRLGAHQAHSSIWTAQHKMATAAAPASRVHGEASRSNATPAALVPPPIALSSARSLNPSVASEDSIAGIPCMRYARVLAVGDSASAPARGCGSYRRPCRAVAHKQQIGRAHV